MTFTINVWAAFGLMVCGFIVGSILVGCGIWIHDKIHDILVTRRDEAYQSGLQAGKIEGQNELLRGMYFLYDQGQHVGYLDPKYGECVPVHDHGAVIGFLKKEVTIELNNGGASNTVDDLAAWRTRHT